MSSYHLNLIKNHLKIFNPKLTKNICVIKQSSTVDTVKCARTKQIINIHVIYDWITATGKLQPDYTASENGPLPSVSCFLTSALCQQPEQSPDAARGVVWGRAAPSLTQTAVLGLGQGPGKQLQPCPGSSHTHRHTQVFTPRVQSSPAVPSAAKGRAACKGQHKPAHKEHTNTFPSSSKAPPIHAFSDSRSIRYWRDLANWLHLSFPRVKIGTEGGWCWLFSLALHFTYARHKRCHYNTGERL